MLEGTESPLFLYQKMLREVVEKLLNEALEERLDLFLIDFTISNDNSINLNFFHIFQIYKYILY